MSNFFSKHIKGDIWIWLIIVFLSLASLLAVYSSTSTLAYKQHGGDTWFYLFRHASLLGVGYIIIFIIHRIPYRWYSKLTVLLLYLSIILLIYTLASGVNLNHAARWIRIGGFTFQSSDVAKLALFLYIARYLSQNQDKIKDFKKGFRPILIWIFLICGLILPANFSTAAMVFVISMIMLFLGRARSTHIMLTVGTIIAIAILAFFIAQNTPQIRNIGRVGTWISRIENFFKDEDEVKDSKYYQDANYQANQAKIAIATGGFFGKGPGKSTQRNFLPHPYSDFIYAIIVEEYGMFGSLFIMSLYILLLYRAKRIVEKAKHKFAAFSALGLSLWLSFQGLINMAVATSLFPVTGQTLPFLSMGGSSILITATAFGIILSVSRDSINEEYELVDVKIDDDNDNDEDNTGSDNNDETDS